MLNPRRIYGVDFFFIIDYFPIQYNSFLFRAQRFTLYFLKQLIYFTGGKL